jgi:hypothetical protein
MTFNEVMKYLATTYAEHDERRFEDAAAELQELASQAIKGHNEFRTHSTRFGCLCQNVVSLYDEDVPFFQYIYQNDDESEEEYIDRFDKAMKNSLCKFLFRFAYGPKLVNHINKTLWVEGKREDKGERSYVRTVRELDNLITKVGKEGKSFLATRNKPAGRQAASIPVFQGYASEGNETFTEGGGDNADVHYSSTTRGTPRNRGAPRGKPRGAANNSNRGRGGQTRGGGSYQPASGNHNNNRNAGAVPKTQPPRPNNNTNASECCNYCGKPGHIEIACFKRFRDLVRTAAPPPTRDNKKGGDSSKP